MMHREYKNGAENEFCRAAEQHGWKVTKRGWPDFFCIRNGVLICVEVKPYRNKKFKKEQTMVMDFLVDKGIPCYRWTPLDGLRRIGKFGLSKTTEKWL